MREIRPYGSEGGGGETLPTPISSRWLSEATPPVMRGGKSCWHPGRGARPYAALSTGGVVADPPQPPATGCDAYGIVAIKKCH